MILASKQIQDVPLKAFKLTFRQYVPNWGLTMEGSTARVEAPDSPRHEGESRVAQPPAVGTLESLRVRTKCDSCLNKCCSQPYDWVYLTEEEIRRLEQASGKLRSEFVTLIYNDETGEELAVLSLPCPFLEAGGLCGVYDSRPFVCRSYPLYLEPLSGKWTLMPGHCGDRLEYVRPGTPGCWGVEDYKADGLKWLRRIRAEASTRGLRTDERVSSGSVDQP